MSKGARAGFLAGVAYGALLAVAAEYSILTRPAGLPAMLPGSLYPVLLVAAPVAVFVYALVVSVLLGAVYGWASERSSREWRPLYALALGLLAGLLLSATINVPVDRILPVLLSPAFFVVLFVYYERLALVFKPEWLAGLGHEEKRVLVELRHGSMKAGELSQRVGLPVSELVRLLARLEEDGYLGISYDNRYFLTEKGRLCAERITSS